MSVLLKVSGSVNIPYYISDLIYEERKNDYSEYLIIFPSKRPVYYLNKNLAEKICAPFIPPIALSFSDFVERVFRKEGNTEAVVSSLDTVFYLYKILEENSYALGSTLRFKSTGDFLPWGFAIERTIDELDRHLLPPDSPEMRMLSRSIQTWEGEIPQKSIELIKSISELRKKLEELLKKENLITNALMFRKIALSGKEIKLDKKFKKTFVLLPYALTPSEKAILNKISSLSKECTFLYQKPQSFGITGEIKEPDFLYSMKFERVEEISSEEIKPQIYIHSAPDCHGEVEILRKILSKMDKEELNKSAIVLVDMSTLPVILWDALSSIDIKYNVTMGYPLTRTPIYSLLELIMKAGENRKGEKIPISLLFNIFKHPYIKTIQVDNENRLGEIINQLEREFKEETVILASSKEIKEIARRIFSKKINAGYMETFIKILDLIFSVTDATNLKTFSKKCLELMDFMFKHSASSNYVFSSLFINKMAFLLFQIMISLISQKELEREEIYFIFRLLAKQNNIPFSGIPLSNLQVMGLLESRGLSFDNVFILDVNEGILPSVSQEDSIIPPSLRRYLNLPLPGQREIIYKYHFSNLITGAKGVHLFYVDTDEFIRSRFVEEIIISAKIDEDRDIKSDKYIPHIRLKTDKKSHFEKTEDILKNLLEEGLSISSINTYLECPAKFFIQKVLKLEQEETLDEDIESRGVGIAVHRVLQEIFKDAIGGSPINDRWIEKKKRILETLIRKEFSPGGKYRDILDATSNIREIITYTSLLYLEKYLDQLKEEIKNAKIEILSLEKSFSAPVSLDNGKKISIKGRIDRIDKVNDQIIIMDYKTGGLPLKPTISKCDPRHPPEGRREISKIIKSFQLPLYIYLFKEKNSQFSYNDLNACLLILREIYHKNTYRSFLFGKEKNSTERNILMEKFFIPALKALVKEIFDPQKPFDTEPVDPESCKNCKFSAFCR